MAHRDLPGEKQPAGGRLFALGHKQRAFTLLELMAVIVIIGVVLSFVVLSTGGDRRAEEMQREAQRLVNLLQLASDEAIANSRQLALRVSQSDYAFMVLEAGKWVPLEDDQSLRPRDMPDDVELRLELQDNPPPGLTAEDSEQPQIFLLSSGEMTPFLLILSADGSEQKHTIKASLLGKLELE